MEIHRVTAYDDRVLIGSGPALPRVTLAPPSMIIVVDAKEWKRSERHTLHATFSAEDVKATRAAVLQVNPTNEPTLRGLAKEQRAIWVFCPMCGRSTKEHAVTLAERMGSDVPLSAFKGRLRCKSCHHRGGVLVPDAVAGDLRR